MWTCRVSGGRAALPPDDPPSQGGVEVRLEGRGGENFRFEDLRFQTGTVKRWRERMLEPGGSGAE